MYRWTFSTAAFRTNAKQKPLLKHQKAASFAVIGGGADGPTALFISSKPKPRMLLGVAAAIAAGVIGKSILSCKNK